VLIAVIALVPVVEALRLSRTAGENIQPTHRMRVRAKA
jgi:hypothetical protein